MLNEVEWLHYADLPGDRGRKVPQLNPRQRVVLIMLIEAHGLSVTDIARHQTTSQLLKKALRTNHAGAKDYHLARSSK